MLTVYDAVLQVVSQTDAQKTTFENVSVAWLENQLLSRDQTCAGTRYQVRAGNKHWRNNSLAAFSKYMRWRFGAVYSDVNHVTDHVTRAVAVCRQGEVVVSLRRVSEMRRDCLNNVFFARRFVSARHVASSDK